MPKIVDERLAANVPLLLVGSVATAVLVCGALAQLCVGRLVERFSPHSLFAVITGLGFLGNLWAAYRRRYRADDRARHRDGGDLRQVTVNDMVLARYTADAWRGRVYAVRYFLLFISAAVAIGMIALLHERGGFTLVLWRQCGDRRCYVPGHCRPRLADHECRGAARRRSRRNNQNSGGIRSSTLTRARFFTLATMRLRWQAFGSRQ